MATIALEYGGDFSLNANGGLAMVTGWDETRQAIERIALTNPRTGENPPDCYWAPQDGLGLASMVGQPINADVVSRAIVAATRQAPGTDPTKAATIVIRENIDHTFEADVTVPLSSGQNQSFTLKVP